MEYFRANKQIGVEKGGGEPVDLLQVGPQLFAWSHYSSFALPGKRQGKRGEKKRMKAET
jgi:hypothetical protein